MSQTLELPPEALMYLIHNIFLPPKLPHADDFDPGYEVVLLDHVVESLLQFKGCIEYDLGDVSDQIEVVIAMVKTLKTLLDSCDGIHTISEQKLRLALKNLCTRGGTIPLHIRAQNAGMIISKVEDSIHIEGFELSPRNEAVLTTRGRLRRCFPGPAFVLKLDTFKNPDFQATMAYTLAKMSHQPAVETQPKVKKAGHMHNEVRDTTHPKLITELFMGGFLRSVGEPVDVPRLWKNTREEVMYFNSQMPWRRSPMWLLVRVTLQMAFSRSASLSEALVDPYKKFMVFLMGHLLDLSRQQSISSDLLHAMYCKISRRLLKLDHLDGEAWLTFVQGVMQTAWETNDASWQKTVEKNTPCYDLSQLESLKFHEDIFMALPALDTYLQAIAIRKNIACSAEFQPKSELVRYQPEKLPAWLPTSVDYMAFNLGAFEAWVALHLHEWLGLHKTSTSTCKKMGDLMQTYHKTAVPFYSGNPEAISVMILTMLELWIACDTSAIQIHELLNDYDPGIPEGLFQSLALPFKRQMERLGRIETYLGRRRARAKYQAGGIFHDFGLPNCFSVRYFLQSSDHRNLFENIERHASQLRDEKRNELMQTKEKYRSLMRLHDASECEYYEVVVDAYNDFRETRHHNKCQKCRYKSQASSLEIEVHEWPLPHDILQAQSTVFELQVPCTFGSWRDTTMSLLLDVLGNEYGVIETPSTRHNFQNYTGLQAYFVPFGSKQRIGLLSPIKPHVRTHRRNKSIPDMTEDDVCVRNGMRYRYHDKNEDSFVVNVRITDETPNLCTYKLPMRSSFLQQFLFRPAAMPSGPAPNTVIAGLSKCPEHMSLEEYKAFSTVPLGFRIQWQNILLQLSAPSIDFKKVESGLMILQTISQAGPPTTQTSLRAGHEILDDERFTHALLASLREALFRFEANWECSQAINTLVCLTRRLLSLTSSLRTQYGCLSYLAQLRTISFGWVKLLRDKVQKETNDDRRADFRSKTIDIALICIDSFNVEDSFLENQLRSWECASTLIQCAIVVQEGHCLSTESSGSLVHILLSRWNWLAYRSYPILARAILVTSSRSLDNAIKQLWSAYQAGGGWSIVSEELDYWLVSRTAAQGSSDPLSVHFNLLTGELLVNGLPLSRLPPEYERHPTYYALFGRSPLEIMPSAVRGMRFSGKQEHAGYSIHFGMEAVPGSGSWPESDLVVQAVKDGRTLEVIPSRLLQGELPSSFVEDFVHWYDIANDCLRFHPIKEPWKMSSRNWSLSKIGVSSTWRLHKDRASLISVKSKSARLLANILNPLVDLFRLHISFHNASSSLEIEAPRLQLGFHLKLGTSVIRSKQFRGMSIDSDQSLGCLVGLRNRIVLKEEKGSTRLVILPDGPVSYRRESDHVHVTIEKARAIRVQAYRINSQLGKLVGNGSLRSMLFLSYLHGITSFCLPDPLTRRTGTEQALDILRSAAVQSFGPLRQEDVDLLRQIASLSPGRSYYPINERVMQTVEWCPNLGFLAQHGEYDRYVRLLFGETTKTRFLFPDSQVRLPDMKRVNSDLRERDLIRSSTFRVWGYGAEDHTIKHDATYSARDIRPDSAQGVKAFTLSSLIYRERANLHAGLAPDLRAYIWDFLSRQTEILGPFHPLPDSEIKYDAALLLDWSTSISRHWSGLHGTLARPPARLDKYCLMMWFSTLAFAKRSDMTILQTLGSFFVNPDMVDIFPPRTSSFRLAEGEILDRSKLRHLIRSKLRPLSSCPEGKLKAYPREPRSAFLRRRDCKFQSSQDQVLDRLVQALETQWPCPNPSIPVEADFRTYLKIEEAAKSVKRKFKTWFDNRQFYEYLVQVDNTLRSRPPDPIRTVPVSFSTPTINLRRGCGFIGIDDVFACAAPIIPLKGATSLDELLLSPAGTKKRVPRLAEMIERLQRQWGSSYEKAYLEELSQSLHSLEQYPEEDYILPEDAKVEQILSNYLDQCQKHVTKTYETISSSVNGVNHVLTLSSAQANAPLLSAAMAVAASVLQGPRISPVLFLRQLARDRWGNLNSDWKHCIVQYGLALTELQRAERLISLSSSQEELSRELQNSGHTNWNPMEYPESLLLEVESGIILREVQEQIARKMRDPGSTKNAVMQLNMGEGKSSVIVPHVAAFLADGSRLVRVIVAKPQSKQMLQMLISKLGGLLARRLYHLPFSRSLRLTEAQADVVRNICAECVRKNGILLVQPEHILSSKLMSLECLILGKEQVGRSLLETQQFFDSSSRDIVDESDENFSAKFELVYTMGTQRPIEHSPERWICIQQLLDLVKMFTRAAESEFPLSLEVDDRYPGCFPRTRFLRLDAEQRILSDVAKHVCGTGLKGFPICRQPEAVREAVFRYMTIPVLTADEIARAEDPGGFWTDTTRQTLLLLRGLIAGGVLSFAFGQKRWRVNYGLDATRQPRTKLAVPYRAKDNPATRSEFSHPDVILILTSLCYYYGGLEEDDLFHAVSHLLASDQPDMEYQAWVRDAPALSPSFRQLSGINLTDRLQCIEELFPPLRYAKSVIDYFLSHLVFPKEMKDFPHKLTASGWDLGQIKAQSTTGFSGTNDSRMTLPLDVEHLDLPEQKHTNALVLEYLLQPENSVALMPPRRNSSGSDAEILLAMVTTMEPSTRVILDVGAQILELSNVEVAREWLGMMSDHDQTQAVVFFDDRDELSVLDLKGNIEPLQTSSYFKQLDLCLIFLDEAHTRGTDLKLPKWYRAAVTLGAGVTKDRLVQACMRMRKLGKGQSVVFCVPEEIETKILAARTSKPHKSGIDVPDVLGWAIAETCVILRRSMPLWMAQGTRFYHQSMLWNTSAINEEVFMSQSQAQRFLEEESRTLEERYRPMSNSYTNSDCQVHSGESHDLMMERCRQFDDLDFNSATLHEEQERELSPEVEQERQVQKPEPAQPAPHRLHPDLRNFVSTGTPVEGSDAYHSAFQTLLDSSAAVHLDVAQFPRELWVTSDFARTVIPYGLSYISDSYQRSVQWILTSVIGSKSGKHIIQHMIIISPYEAQELLPYIKHSTNVTLHLYAPRPNQGYRPLDHLDLYTIPTRSGKLGMPRHLVMQLNLFAGQLYFDSFVEYVEVCNMLGLAWEAAGDGCNIAADGFIDLNSEGRLVNKSSFTGSPVKFLQVFMTKIRRNCEGIDKTHMGAVLDARLLTQSDFTT